MFYLTKIEKKSSQIQLFRRRLTISGRFLNIMITFPVYINTIQISEIIRQHRQKYIKNRGDGWLSEDRGHYRSPYEACGIRENKAYSQPVLSMLTAGVFIK